MRKAMRDEETGRNYFLARRRVFDKFVILAPRAAIIFHMVSSLFSRANEHESHGWQRVDSTIQHAGQPEVDRDNFNKILNCSS